jgi:lactoylglutathione lyase
MILNHLNLTVTNVVATRRFLEKYLGLRSHNPDKENPGFDLLFDENNLVLTLTTGRKGVEITYPETFHIGFCQPREEHMNEINRRLREDGCEVDPPARMHGSWTFYFTCPGGFTIEVLA